MVAAPSNRAYLALLHSAPSGDTSNKTSFGLNILEIGVKVIEQVQI
jgi:hypothetical protein